MPFTTRSCHPATLYNQISLQLETKRMRESLKNRTTESGNYLLFLFDAWSLDLERLIAKDKMNHGESFPKRQLPKIRPILVPFYILLALPLRGKSMIGSFTLKLHFLKPTAKCTCQDCNKKSPKVNGFVKNIRLSDGTSWDMKSETRAQMVYSLQQLCYCSFQQWFRRHRSYHHLRQG